MLYVKIADLKPIKDCKEGKCDQENDAIKYLCHSRWIGCIPGVHLSFSKENDSFSIGVFFSEQKCSSKGSMGFTCQHLFCITVKIDANG